MFVSLAVVGLLGWACGVRTGPGVQGLNLAIVSQTLSGAGADKTIPFNQGDKVILNITADESMEVELHGYDVETRVKPGKTSRLQFTAHRAGRFPLMIHSLGEDEGNRVEILLGLVDILPTNSGLESRSAQAFPVLGAEISGEEVPIKNGQRLSLKGDVLAEVFVTPFPPTPETELQLILRRGEAPLRGAEIIVTYDMRDMDHGVRDRQIGREIADGYYAISLDMLMWGDWVADAVISHPEFEGTLRVLMGVYPWSKKN
ncbi:MAG: hypothetical protein HY667_02575 [Chloroflexi bacterium]|nr:hypothetical protein [Chloroflexota bacterium]